MASVTPMDSEFLLDEDPMGLPRGAWAKSERRILRWRKSEVLGLSQGQFRAYLFPVFTPNGFALTSESPADHPHHNSIWIGSDHVRCKVPGADDQIEDYTYNFYVNETFQGRAAGRILETVSAGEPLGSNGFRINQTLDWRGPSEWGAPEGRVIALEQRVIDISPGETHHTIDILSTLRPTEWDLVIGPTRHAFFNVRLAESMRAAAGGTVLDASGRNDAKSISGSDTEWVDLGGPVGGGHRAGVTVMPHPECGRPWWFVTDWGVVTVGHFRDREKPIAIGESAEFRFRVIVRDGDAAAADIAALYGAYVNGTHK